ncbi:hypothetical protein N665_0268s0035 [Sinapis alba]|nr:hypothetical protein N665_0268s0035 [Sinapis alba]
MNVEEEIQKLEEEIHRLGSLQSDGSYKCCLMMIDVPTSSKLWLGTLRAAKKRKIVVPGELLLQGIHDEVEITLRLPPPPPQAVAATS